MLRKETLKTVLVFVIIIHVLFIAQVGFAVAQSADGDDPDGLACCCWSFCMASTLGIMLLIAAPILSVLYIVFMVVLAFTYVRRDAFSRDMKWPWLWIIMVALLGLVGLVIYFIVRPSGTLALCKKCGKKLLPGAQVCPHCSWNFKLRRPNK